MAINIPDSAQEVEARSKADVQRELQQSNPFRKNSWLGAIVTSSANRVFDFYLQLKSAIAQNFPDTAVGEYLVRWSAIWGKQKLPASQSSGSVVATGVIGSPIPLGVTATGPSSSYTVSARSVISAQSISVLTIERSGQIATATTGSEHRLANNVPVTITGASQSDYNVVDAAITVTGLYTFEFSVSGSPSTPATGSIVASYESASVPVMSELFGSSANLDAGTTLTLQDQLVGVDSVMTVDFGAIGGGVEEESDESLRGRTLDRIQNPVAHFNESDIIDKAKEVPGVTRVFVQPAGTVIGETPVNSINRFSTIANVDLLIPGDFQSGQTITIVGADQPAYNVVDAPILVGTPDTFHYIVDNTAPSPATGTITATVTVPIGQLRVFFMRDNDVNPIPTGSEIIPVRAKIEEILPATTDAANDLFVLSPSAVVVDFTFTSLVPNTSTMRSAIKSNLQQFFSESTAVGSGIDEDAYRSAIFNTVDTVTGEVVRTFTLSTPSGDIPANASQIGVLGNVVFSS